MVPPVTLISLPVTSPELCTKPPKSCNAAADDVFNVPDEIVTLFSEAAPVFTIPRSTSMPWADVEPMSAPLISTLLPLAVPFSLICAPLICKVSALPEAPIEPPVRLTLFSEAVSLVPSTSI